MQELIDCRSLLIRIGELAIERDALQEALAERTRERDEAIARAVGLETLKETLHARDCRGWTYRSNGDTEIVFRKDLCDCGHSADPLELGKAVMRVVEEYLQITRLPNVKSLDGLRAALYDLAGRMEKHGTA